MVARSSSVASLLSAQQISELQADARSAQKKNNPAPTALSVSQNGGSAPSGFKVTVTNPVNSGGYSDYVVSAINNGAGGTGNSILGLDIVVITPGTGASGAMLVDKSDDIDGDGKADANVVGAPDLTFGNLTPTFGSKLGTFLGLPASATGKTVANSFAALVAPMNYETSLGALDAAFSDLHSLQVISAGDVLDNTTAAPFANIVVPTGTIFDLEGYLAGNEGMPQWIDVSNGGSLAGTALIVTTTATLPEPTSVSLLAAGAAGLLRRRRRKRA